MNKKYEVPQETKMKVRNLLNDFLSEQKITKPKLAIMLHEKYGRSSCRTSMLDKFNRASFQLSEVIEIAELFGYELKFVKKAQIEDTEKEC